jgi:hypothetical protein
MKKTISIFLALCLLFCSFAYAHNVREDANGGHKDNKNVSGLGSYHYHHGYPAHLHENGVCPYDDTWAPKPTATPKPTPTPKPAPTPKPTIAPGLAGLLSVHFLDVGQADSILILTPAGKTMLIDAGNNDDGKLVKKYLDGAGVERIDVLIGTHPHEDHIGGLDYVINNFVSTPVIVEMSFSLSLRIIAVLCRVSSLT